MAKRQRITVGAILEIEIEEKYFYAQILTEADCAFFDYQSNQKLNDYSILLNTPVLFIVAVYDDVITQGHWLKVGKLDVRENLKIKPMKFIQDALSPQNFELYDPNTGEIKPARKEECKGLERAAVYEAEDIEERLIDHYKGRITRYRKEDLDVFND